jgi:primosomal protein N' (replication factor Y)
MREELRQGNDLSVSIPLLDAIRENAAHGKQSILFLNRRGNSRALVCVDCRKAPECPRCSARLTYHSANERLMCHYCGYSQKIPVCCPECGGTLKKVGTGTQKVQLELEEMIPGIAVDRMDTDTVSAVNTHEKILNHFQEEKVPVLVGTQMVAKGLDFDNVTLVGVLEADLSLYCGDYHAHERTFSLLAQVVGRAGRRDKPGRAVIQTYTPQHPVIETAANQDYDAFFEQEIVTRKALKAPPFANQFVFRFGGTDERAVQQAARVFADALASQLPQTPDVEPHVLGPVPAPIAKLNKRYFYTVSFRGRATNNSRALVSRMLAAYDRWPGSRSLTVSADIDPYYL